MALQAENLARFEAQTQGFMSGESVSDYPLPRSPIHDRLHPRHEDRPQWDDIKVELLEYLKSLHVEEFLDWLHTIKRVFEYKDVPEDGRVVATRMTGHTSAWWE